MAEFLISKMFCDASKKHHGTTTMSVLKKKVPSSGVVFQTDICNPK